MKVIYDRDKSVLSFGEIIFNVTNIVRNEINPYAVRRLHDPLEVRYTVTAGREKGDPYMPRQFPLGSWEITGVEWYAVSGFDKSEYGLVRIRTNAHQKVQTWTLDKKGGYDKPTGFYVEDYGYLFHFAPNSNTTLGCGRVATQEQANKFAQLCQDALHDGRLFLEVI